MERVWQVGIVSKNDGGRFLPPSVFIATRKAPVTGVVHVEVNGREIEPVNDCTYSKLRKAVQGMADDDELCAYLFIQDKESRASDIVDAVMRVSSTLPPEPWKGDIGEAMLADAMQAVDVMGELLYDDYKGIIIAPVIASGTRNAYTVYVNMGDDRSKTFAVVPPAEGKSDIARLMRDAYEPKEAPGIGGEALPVPEKGRGYLVEAYLTPVDKLVWPLSYKEYKDLYDRRKDVSAVLNVTVLFENEYKDYLSVAQQIDQNWRYREGLYDMFRQFGCNIFDKEDGGNA